MSRRFFFRWSSARASGSKSGAMMTSLKISLTSRARASVSGRLQMMIPPNGACLSVANALSQASRRSGSAADAAGIGVLENGDRRFLEFADELRGGGDIEDVVERKFLAVELLEIRVEIAVQRCLLVRIFAVAQVADQRQR